MLTFEEIVGVNSTDQLRSLYLEVGVDFSNEKQFLKFLKKEWKQKRDDHFLCLPETESKQLKPLEAIVGGINYNIYGVIHTKYTGKKYTAVVNKKLNSEESWLFEQNLGLFFAFPPDAIEVPDHIVRPWSPFRNSFKNGVLLPISLPFYLATKSIGRKLDPFILESLENAALHTLGINTEWISLNIPSYIKIELNERQNPPRYNQIQARSAYQAEFMKAWKREKDKNILVGMQHAPEIKYFLEKGVKDQRIVEVAQSHVDLLERDHEKFLDLIKKANCSTRLTAELGLATGVTTSVMAIYEIFF